MICGPAALLALLASSQNRRVTVSQAEACRFRILPAQPLAGSTDAGGNGNLVHWCDSEAMRERMSAAKIIGIFVLITAGVFLLATDALDNGSTNVLNISISVMCFIGALLFLPPKTA
jgi:hypothetical protein